MGTWNPGPNATAGDDFFTGDGTNETAYGLGGNDTINGGAGNDTLNGGIGDDSLSGGDGVDLLIIRQDEDNVDTIDGGGGTDTLGVVGSTGVHTLVSIERVAFNPLNETPIGFGNLLVLRTDQLGAGISSALRVTGSNQSDTVSVSIVDGDDAPDFSTWTLLSWATTSDFINVTGNSLGNLVTGTVGRNVFYGRAGADTLYGGGGDDTLSASDYGPTGDGAVDHLYGGDGNDQFTIFEAGDTVHEEAGEGLFDQVFSTVSYTLTENVEALQLNFDAAVGTGNSLNNNLSGNASANTLYGLDGNDYMSGVDGADTLDGGAAADTLIGGLGDDLYYVDNALDEIREFAGQGTDTVRSSVTHILADEVENLIITGGSTRNGVGNTLNNTLTGNSAANSLSANDGADTLNGGGGNDTLNGGGGDDSMNGGADSDFYYVNSGDDVVTDTGGGIDTVSSSITYTLTAGVENLIISGSSSRTGTGNTLDNALTGNSAGNRLRGLDGADTLSGGGGNDTLEGGNGADVLNGGVGADSMTGGAGADAFVFNVAASLDNADTIADFNVTDDIIHLDNAIFTALADGALSSAAFRIGTSAGDASDRVIYNPTTGALYYDANGDAAGSVFRIATLSTGLALTNNDFLVI